MAVGLTLFFVSFTIRHILCHIRNEKFVDVIENDETFLINVGFFGSALAFPLTGMAIYVIAFLFILMESFM